MSWRLLAGTSLVLAAAAIAGQPPAPPVWPDTPHARAQALALVQSLNADLLGHASATLTLERWCAVHRLATPARIVAHRGAEAADRALPPDLRRALGVAPGTPLRYRHVELACGERVLAEADNWYLPGRLTAAMNRTLDTTETPFGKVVAPLHFRRHTLSARLLWPPPPDRKPAAALPARPAGRLAIPHHVLQHRALLEDARGRPFSALVETYTAQVLAFPPPAPHH